MCGKVVVEKFDKDGNVIGIIDYFDKIDMCNCMYSFVELKF